MLKLSKDEFQLWLDSGATDKVFAILESKRAQFIEILTSGQTLGPNVEQETARIVGILQGLDMALKIEIEESEEDNDKNE